MYSTSDLDSAARSSHNEDGENAADAYMDKFARVIELVRGDDQFNEWHDVCGDMLHAAVFETMESHTIDFDRILKLLDPSSDLRPMTIANVMHDFTGLVRYFNFRTEKLEHAFMPRFAKLDHHWVDEHIVE